MAEVAFEGEKTRAQRDAEGWANAIVLSSDDDEDVPVVSGLKRQPPFSTGRMAKKPHVTPKVEETDEKKPDISASHLPAMSSPIVQPNLGLSSQTPTDLADVLSFSEPIKGAKPNALRAGHVLLKISSAGSAAGSSAGSGASEIVLGTGLELSAISKLHAVSYRASTNRPQLFAAITHLSNPNNYIIGSGRSARRVPLIECEWQPKLPWKLKHGQPPAEVRLDVWLSPEIFDLRISTWHSSESCFYNIWLLMDALQPMAPIVETPRPPPVQGGAVLAPCGAAHAPNKPPPSSHSFTLAGLMRAMESAGYEEMADPAGLELTLWPFQRQTLQWLYDRETQPGGLNALFWREHPTESGRSFYYNAMAGELRDKPLPIVTGGFLCEGMPHRRDSKTLVSLPASDFLSFSLSLSLSLSLFSL
jgi:hypothetical protein